MNVDPTPEQLGRFLDQDPGGPFVMLNLLRYREGGRESYGRYAQAAAPFLEAAGGEVVYAGDPCGTLVAPDSHRWDTLLLVRYPSREAFMGMIGDPAYRAITHLRSDALEAAVLEATTPWA